MQMRKEVRRYGVLAAFTTACVLAAAVVAHASQTLTVPNAAVYNYNLAAGASSAAIAPVTNQAVLILGVQTTLGYRGVGSATILSVPASFIEWVGLESPASGAITQGFSGSAGTHILYLDYSSQVDVQVAGPDTILIHNGAASARTGSLKLIW
jgi:hypothetical protein